MFLSSCINFSKANILIFWQPGRGKLKFIDIVTNPADQKLILKLQHTDEWWGGNYHTTVLCTWRIQKLMRLILRKMHNI